MKSCILSVDLGTSSLKAGIYDLTLNNLLTVRCPYNLSGSSSESTNVLPMEWWNAFLDALRAVSKAVPLKSIECISFSGYNALVGVGEDCVPCSETISYFDRRPYDYCVNYFSEDAPEYIFKKTGNRLLSNGTWASVLIWMSNERQTDFNRARCFLSSSGFIAARLTGSFAVDSSRASLTLLHNPLSNELSWDDELCGYFNIDKSKLPSIYNPWDGIGVVSKKASSETGIKDGVPVVIGGMDSMCAALGSGITGPDMLFDIGGTAGGLAAVSERPCPDDRFYTVRYVLPGKWSSIAPLNAAGSVWKWFKEAFAQHMTDDELVHEASKIQPGAEGLIFLPYINGARFPYWNAGMSAHFIGVSMNHKLGHFTRAILEGIGFAYKEIVESFYNMGFKPKEIRAAGGGSDNVLWTTIKSDILGLPYLALKQSESAALGAAILGAYGIGAINNIQSAAEKIATDMPGIYPDKGNFESYHRIYDSFMLYNRLNYIYGKV